MVPNFLTPRPIKTFKNNQKTMNLMRMGYYSTAFFSTIRTLKDLVEFLSCGDLHMATMFLVWIFVYMEYFCGCLVVLLFVLRLWCKKAVKSAETVSLVKKPEFLSLVIFMWLLMFFVLDVRSVWSSFGVDWLFYCVCCGFRVKKRSKALKL
jgi:hypothetical protein